MKPNETRPLRSLLDVPERPRVSYLHWLLPSRVDLFCFALGVIVGFVVPR